MTYLIKFRSKLSWNTFQDDLGRPHLFGNPVAAWAEATDLLNKDGVVAVSIAKF